MLEFINCSDVLSTKILRNKLRSVIEFYVKSFQAPEVSVVGRGIVYCIFASFSAFELEMHLLAYFYMKLETEAHWFVLLKVLEPSPQAVGSS